MSKFQSNVRVDGIKSELLIRLKVFQYDQYIIRNTGTLSC